jgi:signal recognition particle subunit SRP54
VQVARASIEHAQRRNHDVVVVDTAGRLGIDAELMQQAADIRDAVQPDEVLFVVDAMIGQDAVVTAQAFQDGVGFTGVVLTKLDGDARGWRALSVRHLTGQPILFASTGEKLGDFDVFHPERMASRILGMGDVLTLIEQAEKSFDAGTAERMAGKMMEGKEFDLEDFLEQMLQVKKMGSLTSLLGMLPGLGGQLKEAISQVDDKDLDRIAAIIRSMTPQERRDPKVLNGSRRTRIANGSGTTVTEVNGLVDRFYEAQKMMKQMGGMAGMAGLPGAGRKAKRQQAKGGKKKKGPGRAGGGPSKAGGGEGAAGAAAAAGHAAAAAGLLAAQGPRAAPCERPRPAGPAPPPVTGRFAGAGPRPARARRRRRPAGLRRRRLLGSARQPGVRAERPGAAGPPGASAAARWCSCATTRPRPARRSRPGAPATRCCPRWTARTTCWSRSR